MSKESLKFSIQTIGPISDFDLEFRYGLLNRLIGANGVGKTTAIFSAVRALGGNGRIAPTHGAKAGLVQGPGDLEAKVSRTGRVTRSGEVPIQPGDLEAMTDLITGGGLKGEKPRNAERIKAFVRLVKPPVDDRTLETLCPDEQTQSWLRTIVDERGLDLLSATEELKRRLYEDARSLEEEAQTLSGKRDVHRDQVVSLGEEVAELLGGEELGTEELEELARGVDPEGTAELRDAATRTHDRLEASHRERLRVEALQVEARESIGEEPNVDAAQRAVEEAESAEQSAYEQLVRAQERHEEAMRESRRAKARATEVATARERWEKQREILDRDIEGATQAEVEEALRRQEQLGREARVAELLVRWRDNHEQDQRLSVEAKRVGEQAAGIRSHGEGLTQAVAALLDSAGAEGWSIRNEELCYQDGDRIRPYDELSPGEKVKAAIEVASKQFEGLIYIDPHFYRADLDNAGRRLIDEIAAERRDLLIVTETATAGPLRVVYGAPEGESTEDSV